MKNKEKQVLTEYEEDCIWMSYRYCIGRHTIATHCHAGSIANNAYGRMTKERTQFMSKDINQEIYNHLHVHDWFCIDNIWNLKDFRPLDVLYQCLNAIGLKTYDDIKKIKGIECFFTKEGELKTDVYYYNDKDKFNYKSFWDIIDLEVWQRLANLFDIDNHKWCKLTDGKIVEYYEFWTHYNTKDGIEFKKLKSPIDTHNIFSVTRFIDEQFIEKDNINPKDYESNIP